MAVEEPVRKRTFMVPRMSLRKFESDLAWSRVEASLNALPKTLCPTCRVPFRWASLREGDDTLKELLDELEVYCPLSAEGCEWKGPRANLQTHTECTCGQTCENAKHGCVWKGSPLASKAHSAECAYGKETCTAILCPWSGFRYANSVFCVFTELRLVRLPLRTNKSVPS